jgi:hypothetical protein
LTADQADEFQEEYQKEFGILTLQPLKDGLSGIIKLIL